MLPHIMAQLHIPAGWMCRCLGVVSIRVWSAGDHTELGGEIGHRSVETDNPTAVAGFQVYSCDYSQSLGIDLLEQTVLHSTTSSDGFRSLSNPHAIAHSRLMLDLTSLINPTRLRLRTAHSTAQVVQEFAAGVREAVFGCVLAIYVYCRKIQLQ